MINTKMYVYPTGDPFPRQSVPGAKKNRMIGPEGLSVMINSYYTRGIRSGALRFGDPPENKALLAKAAKVAAREKAEKKKAEKKGNTK